MADISKRIKSPRRERGDYAAKTAAYTLKSSDSGTIYKWNSATAFTFQLPPVQKALKGVFYDFIIQTAATGGTGHGISPAAVDKIFAPGVTATDDKDIYFATAADAVGNGFRLVSDGVDGWHLIALNGTISQEA
ncbi:MAG: hypothetical protein EBU54_12745 [Mycobacteriaceae bacterium]|nr:hypothetical protein [Mycobacteriaceae bacterium]